MGLVGQPRHAEMPTSLHFDHGTLVAIAPSGESATLNQWMVADPRTGTYRAPAYRYREVVLGMRDQGLPVVDNAKRFEPLALPLTGSISPYPHQSAALEAWTKTGSRGIVELPTGAGKTILAVLAIARIGRPTLVVVPTIDLLVQWQKILERWFQRPVGMLGGGSRRREELTVTTFDSAAMQTEFLGDRFGFLVVDECHHLPAACYRFVAEGSLAPFRLGLTATLGRADARERITSTLLGPLVYQVPIDALEGTYLAPYEVHPVPVQLNAEEQKIYESARKTYIQFVRSEKISFANPSGWAHFISRAHQSAAGREAFACYRAQRRIALTSQAKLDALWEILIRHQNDQILIFTENNDAVYRIAERFLLPAITHQTKAPERKRLLDDFSKRAIPALVTSRVLNEGVDIPDANVGIVVSGTGSVREHVQRLGRILRKRPGKHAVLYEIYTDVAAESQMSERRNQHRAYQGGETTRMLAK